MDWLVDHLAVVQVLGEQRLAARAVGRAYDQRVPERDLVLSTRLDGKDG